MWWSCHHKNSFADVLFFYFKLATCLLWHRQISSRQFEWEDNLVWSGVSGRDTRDPHHTGRTAREKTRDYHAGLSPPVTVTPSACQLGFWLHYNLNKCMYGGIHSVNAKPKLNPVKANITHCFYSWDDIVSHLFFFFFFPPQHQNLSKKRVAEVAVLHHVASGVNFNFKVQMVA